MKLLFAINYSKFLLQNPQGLVLRTITLKRQWNKSCSKSSFCVTEITVSWTGSPGSKDKSQGWVVCFRGALSPIRLGAHPARAVSCWCWQTAPAELWNCASTLSPAAPLGQPSLTKHTPFPIVHVNIHETWKWRWISHPRIKVLLGSQSCCCVLHHCCFHILFQLVPFHPPGHKDKHHALEVMIHTSCH